MKKRLPLQWASYSDYLQEVRGKGATYGYVYFVGPLSGPIKIGFTRDFYQRMKGLQKLSPFTLHVWAVIEGTTLCEASMHRKFAADRLHGEWFTLTPELGRQMVLTRELSGHPSRFSRTPELLAEIERLSSL